MQCSQRGQVAFEEEGKAENHPLVTGVSSCNASELASALLGRTSLAKPLSARTGVRDEAESRSRRRISPLQIRPRIFFNWCCFGGSVPGAAGDISNSATVGCKD